MTVTAMLCMLVGGQVVIAFLLGMCLEKLRGRNRQI
jgi:hypothetical protein